MSEKRISVPEECPLCDRVGTVWFQEYPKQVRGKDGRTAVYKHVACYCTGCGESFVPARLMDENLRRARKALGELEVADGN